MKAIELTRTLLITAVAMALTAGCSDRRPGGGIVDPTSPGVLVASLASPNADDRAVLVEITGPQISDVQAASSTEYAVHSRVAGTIVKAAVFGNLQSGQLLRFTVPDVNAASRYTARVTEASGPENTLREDVEGYRVLVAPQP